MRELGIALLVVGIVSLLLLPQGLEGKSFPFAERMKVATFTSGNRTYFLFREHFKDVKRLEGFLLRVKVHCNCRNATLYVLDLEEGLKVEELIFNTDDLEVVKEALKGGVKGLEAEVPYRPFSIFVLTEGRNLPMLTLEITATMRPTPQQYLRALLLLGAGAFILSRDEETLLLIRGVAGNALEGVLRRLREGGRKGRRGHQEGHPDDKGDGARPPDRAPGW